MQIVIDDEGLTSKKSGDYLEYSFNWADELESDTLILTSSWSIAVIKGSAGLTASVPSKSAQSTSVFLDAGVRGSRYRVTNTITTNEVTPQIESRSFDLVIT